MFEFIQIFHVEDHVEVAKIHVMKLYRKNTHYYSDESCNQQAMPTSQKEPLEILLAR